MRKPRSTTKFPGLYLRKLPPEYAAQVERTFGRIANRQLYHRINKLASKETIQMSAYQKSDSYFFDADDETLETWAPRQQDDGIWVLEIVETRKNGQEDCHMSGMAVSEDGKRWKWDEDEGENFSDYHSKSLADAILKYINKNDPMQMIE